MTDVEVRFEDTDGDGDREVVVENSYLRAVLRFPEQLGEAFYGRRFTWGGRLQSLIYKPTGREHFMPEMIDPEDVRPFGLPDELFAYFPMESADGRGERRLKMGVGVSTVESGTTALEPLPWTWRREQREAETVVVFRQEATELGGYGFVYEKHYRFRADSAWFAMDVVLENNGDKTIASDWDIHSFHRSGAPPHSSWLLAPKRAWISYGQTRRREVVKEASPIFATLDINTYVADGIEWDLDEPGWWYALGPGDGEEFYLLRGRFEPYRGLFWQAWHAFTPQGISHVEVPPGDRATWGFDVTLGERGRNFVKAGEDCGLTIDRDPERRTARVAAHVSSGRQGCLRVCVLDQTGAPQHAAAQEGAAQPGRPLQLEVALPASGDFAILRISYTAGEGEDVLHARETVPLAPQRPTAHLPFKGGHSRLFVASDEGLANSETDHLHLCSHAIECGFAADWPGAGPEASESLEGYAALCLVGDAWPLERVSELCDWVEAGGGLLMCGPFLRLVAALGDLVPLIPLGDGLLQQSDTELGLQLGAPHPTTERLMLEPDAAVRISWWVPTTARSGALVALRFTDPESRPAVALREAGRGRVAAVASRPAWGKTGPNVIWDGWGQYHRACFGGLIGWVARAW